MSDGRTAIAVSGNVANRNVAAGVDAYGGRDVMFAVAGIIKPMHFLDV